MVSSLRYGAPECVWDAGATLGEEPVWVDAEASLYWVDIKGQFIHRYEAGTGAQSSWSADEMISCILPQGQAGHFIAGAQSGLHRIRLLEDGRVEQDLIVDPEPDYPGNRMNDGKRAPDGSVWAGTMDNAEVETSGAWWRFTEAGSAEKLVDGFKVTNGPAFDIDRSRVFLTDSAAQTVFVGDLLDHGAGLGPLSVFLSFGAGDGYPDGMTVDSEGCLWMAFWDGGCVRRFSANGEELLKIDLPAQRPTSVCFNADESELYVTSAAIGLENSGLDGGLFRIRLEKT